MRCLCQIYCNIEDAILSYLTPTSSECIAQLLNLYFQSYEPVKRVTQEINLSDVIGCFDTRVPDIDCLLSDMTEATQFKLSLDVANLAPDNIKPSRASST